MSTFPEVTEGWEPALPDHTHEKQRAMKALILIVLVAPLDFLLPWNSGVIIRLAGLLGVPVLFVTWYEYRRLERGGSPGIFMKILIAIPVALVFQIYLMAVSACLHLLVP